MARAKQIQWTVNNDIIDIILLLKLLPKELILILRVGYQYRLSFVNFTNKVIIFINSIDVCFSLSLSLNLFYNFKNGLEGRYLLVVVEYTNNSCMISLKIYNMIAMDNFIMPKYSIIIIHKIGLCFILQISTCFLEGPKTTVRHTFWTNRIQLWYHQ